MLRVSILGLALLLLLTWRPASAAPAPQTAPQETTQESTEPATTEPATTEPATQNEDSEAAAPEQTPAQRLQGEIFVLAAQAEGLIRQAEAQEEISEELQPLITETKTITSEAAQADSISSLPRLERLRERLLDAPLRLHDALGRAQSVVEAPAQSPPSSRPEARPTPTEPAQRTATVPAALRDGALAYFAGNYPRTLDLLGEASYSKPRAQAVALLLRAAARYSLFLISDGEDESPLAVARADIRECKRLAPWLQPDPDLFSPRFVRFFAQLSGPGRQGS